MANDADLLIEIHDELVQVEGWIEDAIELRPQFVSSPLLKVQRRLRKLISQLPPCSPEQFAHLLGTALSKRRVKKLEERRP